jgi:hypothetical protein
MTTSLLMNTNLKNYLLVLAVGMLSVNCFAQADTTMDVVPELIFRNPVLVSGKAKMEGAIYKFSNIAPGIDGQIKLKKFSDPAIIVNSIDNNTTGYDKAFQPEFGMDPVKKNQDWYIDFELTFYTAGTNKKLKIDKFAATSLDVDGDGSNVQEYIIMDKATSVTYSALSYLGNGGASAVIPTCGTCGKASNPITCANCQGAGVIISGTKTKKCTKCDGVGKIYSLCGHPFDGLDAIVEGPVDNFASIDTISTGVMASYVYNNKDVITFRIGAQSGNKTGGAGIRMNSIWFKGFSMVSITPLPVKISSFTAALTNGNVLLNWKASEQNFNRYVLQRSTDGKNYSDVAVEFSNTNSSNYAYKDAGISSNTGIVLYRLKMIDNTGEFMYSEIKTIRIAKQAETVSLSAYPNPVIDQVRISLPASWQGKAVNIGLYSINGVAVQNIKINSARQTESMSLNTINKGFYVIKVSCNGEVAQQQIIKN